MPKTYTYKELQEEIKVLQSTKTNSRKPLNLPLYRRIEETVFILLAGVGVWAIVGVVLSMFGVK